MTRSVPIDRTRFDEIVLRLQGELGFTHADVLNLHDHEILLDLLEHAIIRLMLLEQNEFNRSDS